MSNETVHRSYVVETKDGLLGTLTVYDGLVVQASWVLADFLGREWATDVLPHLRQASDYKTLS